MNQPPNVTFHRHRCLRGVELRYFHDLAQGWHCYSTGYDFIVPISWVGRAWCRGQELCLRPGLVLCAPPDQIYLVRQAQEGGTIATLTIDTELWEASAAKVGHNLGANASPVAMSPRLADLFKTLTGRLQDSVQPPDSRALLEAFVCQALLEGTLPNPATKAPSTERALRCIRLKLDEDGERHVDLATLAALTGLSRFQVLRAFKRRYGLPPHTYQLRVRLGKAQEALRRGEAPAMVAAATGFVDQSHLARHFKRALGVTPGQYVRAGVS